jgi:hypothetical protein
MILMKGSIVLLLTFVILSNFACGVQTQEDVDTKIQASQKLRQIDRVCGELPKPYSFRQIKKGLSGNASSSIVYYQFVSDQSFGDVRQFYRKVRSMPATLLPRGTASTTTVSFQSSGWNEKGWRLS